MDYTHVFLVAALLVLQASADTCPPDALQRAQKCLSSVVGSASGGSASPSPTFDFAQIRPYCSDGRLHGIIDCVEGLMSECKDAPQMSMLRLIVDISDMRRGVKTLCDNVDDIEAAAPCLSQQSNQMSQCAQNELSHMTESITQNAGNITAMLIAQCRFMTVMIQCQRTALGDVCGNAVANTYADFMISFVPTSCSKQITDLSTKAPLATKPFGDGDGDDEDDSHKDHMHGSSSTVAISVMVQVLQLFMFTAIMWL